jgi:CBS domain containing-hemolysin-like protein
MAENTDFEKLAEEAAQASRAALDVASKAQAASGLIGAGTTAGTAAKEVADAATDLLVMNNVVNLGGMYAVGKSLKAGARSASFSFVISAVIVVLIGEVVAKCVGFGFSASTASWTVRIVSPFKMLLGGYTSRLVSPIQLILKKCGSEE